MTPHRRIWIFGATAAIAQSYARRRAAEAAHFLLLGRDERHLRANAMDLVARGAASAECEVVDFVAPIDREAFIDDLIAAHGSPDEILIAYGILGEQARALGDGGHAAEIIEVNFTSVVGWLLAIVARRDEARALALIVIGSVAGDRGRASNFVYGSAKGGLDRFLEGLQHAHARTSLHVLRVKPGFVDTPMTATMTKGGPLWAHPDRIAVDIVRAADRGKSVVYTPWFWSPIMFIIRNLPAVIFHRLNI